MGSNPTSSSKGVCYGIGDISGQEVLQKYQEIELSSCCFEGDSGLKRLNQLFRDLGYPEQSFRYGSSLEQFLSDNYGCIEVMLEWIADQMDGGCTEWKDALSMDEENDDD